MSDTWQGCKGPRTELGGRQVRKVGHGMASDAAGAECKREGQGRQQHFCRLMSEKRVPRDTRAGTSSNQAVRDCNLNLMDVVLEAKEH